MSSTAQQSNKRPQQAEFESCLKKLRTTHNEQLAELQKQQLAELQKQVEELQKQQLAESQRQVGGLEKERAELQKQLAASQKQCNEYEERLPEHNTYHAENMGRAPIKAAVERVGAIAAEIVMALEGTGPQNEKRIEALKKLSADTMDTFDTSNFGLIDEVTKGLHGMTVQDQRDWFNLVKTLLRYADNTYLLNTFPSAKMDRPACVEEVSKICCPDSIHERLEKKITNLEKELETAQGVRLIVDAGL